MTDEEFKASLTPDNLGLTDEEALSILIMLESRHPNTFKKSIEQLQNRIASNEIDKLLKDEQ